MKIIIKTDFTNSLLTLLNLEMDSLWLTCRRTFGILLAITFILNSLAEENENQVNDSTTNTSMYLYPTVMIAILIRNKEHVLPWFFGHLETLNYPKDRIALWIQSDHNVDNTSAIIQTWINAERHNYHWVDVQIDNSTDYEDQRGPCDWSASRFDKVIALRQDALDTARKMWADFLFMLDSDVVLEHKDMLSILINQDKAVIGPMLNSSEGGTYSNFWGGMTEQGYYKRVLEYFDIVDRKDIGVYKVPMVHSAVLINLRMSISKQFYYKPQEGYDGPHDDIIIFAKSVLAADSCTGDKAVMVYGLTDWVGAINGSGLGLVNYTETSAMVKFDDSKDILDIELYDAVNGLLLAQASGNYQVQPELIMYKERIGQI